MRRCFNCGAYLDTAEKCLCGETSLTKHKLSVCNLCKNQDECSTGLMSEKACFDKDNNRTLFIWKCGSFAGE